MSIEYKIGDVLEVEVIKIIPNGLGLCFAEKLTVFVPLSVAGDKLRVEIRKVQSRTAFARIVEIIEPSENRIEPKCEYFGKCGGCDFQQMSYETQIEAKVGIIKDSFKRIGKIDLEDDDISIIPSPKEYGYRLRSQWHIDSREKKIGYFKRQTHDVIETKTCPILVPALEEKLQDLQNNLEYGTLFAESLNVEAAIGENDISIYSEELMEPIDDIYYELDGERFFFNAKSFFQGNKFAIKDLVEAAVGDAKGRTAIDFFCGVGLFSLSMAENFERVLGVEANKRAINFANHNAEQSRTTNVEFYGERVKNFLRDKRVGEIDFVLLDPPRSGVKRSTMEEIAALGSPKITYVSCNPSTLARDLQVLIEKGYEIEKTIALDLFPQTHHVETIVKLKMYVNNTKLCEPNLNLANKNTKHSEQESEAR